MLLAVVGFKVVLWNQQAASSSSTYALNTHQAPVVQCCAQVEVLLAVCTPVLGGLPSLELVVTVLQQARVQRRAQPDHAPCRVSHSCPG